MAGLGNAKRNYVAIVVAAFALAVCLLASGKHTRYRFETCKLCKSTRQIKSTIRIGPFYYDQEIKVIYRSPNFASCQHQWGKGISSAVDGPVSDGRVILVRLGNSYGAFILTNQTMNPGRTDFIWYFRSDGKGILDSQEPAVTQGKGSGSKIRFGPFDVAWSSESNGRGYIYYKHFPGDVVDASSLRICVTGLEGVDKINASDPKWIYKGSPTDPGS